MSETLVQVITRVGLAAVVNAQNTGVQATIDKVAIGRGVLTGSTYGGYSPTKDATKLANEVIRVPIISGTRLDPVGFRVLARIPKETTPNDFAAWEVGFFLSTGELFCLWSSTAFPIAAKTGLADIDLALDLFLDQIPLSALAITVTEPDIPDTTGVLAELLSCGLRTFIADLAAEKRAASHHAN